MTTPNDAALLLCADLDRTLIPNGAQPESPAAREMLRRLADHDHVQIAYVSGRDAGLVHDAIRDYALPTPDFVIGDVGTSIYSTAGGDGWQMLDSWVGHIAPDWEGRAPGDLLNALDTIEGLSPQEPAKQNRFKVSFYIDLCTDSEATLAQAAGRLKTLGVETRLVYSIDEQADTGLLDVLPERAGKLQAIEFLMHTLGYDENSTVFAGDSGNDLDVLGSRIPAVLVANASDDIRQSAVALSAENGFADRLYLARGSFIAMNGNYAAGVIEGIAHYRPMLRDWLLDLGGNL